MTIQDKLKYLGYRTVSIEYTRDKSWYEYGNYIIDTIPNPNLFIRSGRVDIEPIDEEHRTRLIEQISIEYKQKLLQEKQLKLENNLRELLKLSLISE